MNELKTLLDKNNVEYTEKQFNTSAGIKGLGPNPFVSSDGTREYNSNHLPASQACILHI